MKRLENVKLRIHCLILIETIVTVYVGFDIHSLLFIGITLFLNIFLFCSFYLYNKTININTHIRNDYEYKIEKILLQEKIVIVRSLYKGEHIVLTLDFDQFLFEPNPLKVGLVYTACSNKKKKRILLYENENSKKD